MKTSWMKANGIKIRLGKEKKSKWMEKEEIYAAA